MGDTSSEGKVASANGRSVDGSQSGPGELRWSSVGRWTAAHFGHFNTRWSKELSSKIHTYHFDSLLLRMDSLFAFTLSEHQSSLASKQTHSFTVSKLSCQVQMNSCSFPNKVDYPRKCTLVCLRQTEHLWCERGPFAEMRRETNSDGIEEKRLVDPRLDHHHQKGGATLESDSPLENNNK